jgi:hypothetical protein
MDEATRRYYLLDQTAYTSRHAISVPDTVNLVHGFPTVADECWNASVQKMGLNVEDFEGYYESKDEYKCIRLIDSDPHMDMRCLGILIYEHTSTHQDQSCQTPVLHFKIYPLAVSRMHNRDSIMFKLLHGLESTAITLFNNRGADRILPIPQKLVVSTTFAPTGFDKTFWDRRGYHPKNDPTNSATIRDMFSASMMPKSVAKVLIDSTPVILHAHKKRKSEETHTDLVVCELTNNYPIEV